MLEDLKNATSGMRHGSSVTSGFQYQKYMSTEALHKLLSQVCRVSNKRSQEKTFNGFVCLC